MRKVTKYIARDETLHDSADAARFHEEKLDLMEYLDENPICVSAEDKRLRGHEFAIWLHLNPRVFIKLLPEPEDELSRSLI